MTLKAWGTRRQRPPPPPCTFSSRCCSAAMQKKTRRAVSVSGGPGRCRGGWAKGALGALLIQGRRKRSRQVESWVVFFFWWGGKGLGGTPSRSARPLPVPFILQLTCTCPSTESRCPCWTGTTIEGPSACVRGKGWGPRQTIIGDRSGRERTRKRGQRALKREMLAVCSLTPRRGTP